MPKPWSHRAVLLGVLFVASLTGACNDGDSPTAPPADAVSIESISPIQGTVLQRGSNVTFNVTARYRLISAPEGRLALVIQDQANRNIAGLPQPQVRILQGEGTATLTDDVQIPSSGVTSVTVFVPLSPQGVSQTSVVASVRYDVG